MTTSPAGQRITLADRLAEISERYGAEHPGRPVLATRLWPPGGTVEHMWAAGVRDESRVV